MVVLFCFLIFVTLLLAFFPKNTSPREHVVTQLGRWMQQRVHTHALGGTRLQMKDDFEENNKKLRSGSRYFHSTTTHIRKAAFPPSFRHNAKVAGYSQKLLTSAACTSNNVLPAVSGADGVPLFRNIILGTLGRWWFVSGVDRRFRRAVV